MTDPTVTLLSSVDDFWASAGEFLLAREAEHCLIIGLCANLRQGMTYGDALPVFAVVSDKGRTQGVAMRTPPHPVTLSEFDSPDAVRLVARELSAADPALNGVSGPAARAADFAKAWTSITGASASRVMSLRVHRLEKLNPLPSVPGRMRPAEPQELGLLASWAAAFHAEALGSHDEDPAKIRVGLEGRLAAPGGGLVVWEDGEIVSMAAFGGPTPNGIRINLVYTPPQLRGRGYASACVGALSERLLEQGRRFCFLFTDLANPTSNKIYARIGYERVADVDRYDFAARPYR
ncbi:MAG TPA: GNAT family N-acetyltransferase [Actinomycetota bacterium]|nr:GNAT family N-acetyltransferase [Actinomycetota bacterium]